MSFLGIFQTFPIQPSKPKLPKKNSRIFLNEEKSFDSSKKVSLLPPLGMSFKYPVDTGIRAQNFFLFDNSFVPTLTVDLREQNSSSKNLSWFLYKVSLGF